jgi:hypothetical protein
VNYQLYFLAASLQPTEVTGNEIYKLPFSEKEEREYSDAGAEDRHPQTIQTRIHHRHLGGARQIMIVTH